MKTENLTKTNLEGLNPNLVAEVEQLLKKEIDAVYNYREGYNKSMAIANGISDVWTSSVRPFSMVNQNYSFNEADQTISVTGRNKWQRKMTTKIFTVEKVGYKLNTTHMPATWLYGNPKPITE